MFFKEPQYDSKTPQARTRDLAEPHGETQQHPRRQDKKKLWKKTQGKVSR